MYGYRISQQGKSKIQRYRQPQIYNDPVYKTAKRIPERRSAGFDQRLENNLSNKTYNIEKLRTDYEIITEKNLKKSVNRQKSKKRTHFFRFKKTL